MAGLTVAAVSPPPDATSTMRTSSLQPSTGGGPVGYRRVPLSCLGILRNGAALQPSKTSAILAICCHGMLSLSANHASSARRAIQFIATCFLQVVLRQNACRVRDEDHLIARPDERLNAHLKRLAVERKSPEVQVRPEGRGDGRLISDRPIGSDVQRPIGDIGGSGIDKLELRPPHRLQLLDGGFLEEALWLGLSKGESRIVPPEYQIERSASKVSLRSAALDRFARKNPAATSSGSLLGGSQVSSAVTV